MHLILFNDIDIYVSFSSHKMKFKEMLIYNANIILHISISILLNILIILTLCVIASRCVIRIIVNIGDVPKVS